MNTKGKDERTLKSSRALTIKFFFVTTILFGIAGMGFGWWPFNIIVTSLFLTGTTYFLVDSVIFPLLGNFGATLTDFALSFIIIWSMGTILSTGGPIPLLATPLGCAVAFAVAEWFFHRHIMTRVSDPQTRNKFPV